MPTMPATHRTIDSSPSHSDALPEIWSTAMATTTPTTRQAPAVHAAPRIDIGIDEADRKQVADGLSHFLADAYTL